MISTCRGSEPGGPRWEGRAVQRGSAHEGLEVGRHGALGQRGAVTSGHAGCAGRGRGRHRTAASKSKAWTGHEGGALTVPAGEVPLGQLPRAAMEGGVELMARWSLGLTMTPKSTA